MVYRMTGAEIYIMANGGVLILILGQLLKIEGIMGERKSLWDRLLKRCPYLNGNEKEKEDV